MFAQGGASRTELFALWMDKNKDFKQVKLELTRRSIDRTTANDTEGTMTRLQLENCGKYSTAPFLPLTIILFHAPIPF